MRSALIMILAAVLLPIACQNQEATRGAVPAAAQASVTPEDLGELGAKIMRQPDRTRELLAEKGLDHEEFEQAVRRVSEDREAARRYAAAFKQQM